jgi:sulfur-oxidizing protein SoxA
VSPAFLTGFPIYRFSWQTMGNLDRRLRACYSGVQASVPTSGNPELRALELFLKKRSEGMLWDGPSLRR